jgi:type IV pilus assembly protein PilF
MKVMGHKKMEHYTKARCPGFFFSHPLNTAVLAKRIYQPGRCVDAVATKLWTRTISMKVSFRLLSLFLVLLLSVFACASTKEKQEKQGKQAVAYRELAEAYLFERQYTLALQELLKAEKLRPDSALIHNDLGLVYMEKDKLELSVQHFKKAVELKPDYPEAINNLARALLEQEKWDEAILYLKELIKNLVYTTPQYPLLNLGWAYFNKKDYVQAEKYYKQAIMHYDDGLTRDMTYIRALGGLGRTHIATGNFAQALSALSLAAQAAPGIPDTYFYIGQAYEKAGKPGDAKMAYLKVIEVAPDSEIANKAARAALKLQ